MRFVVWLLLCGIWGTTWLFIKLGLEDLPPLSFATIRFVIAIVVVASVMRLRRIPFPRGGADWKLLGITGILQFTINYAFVFWSEQYITSGLAAVLQAMIPVFGLVLAAFYLPDEHVTWLKGAALAAGVAGVAVIFQDQLRFQSVMAFAGSVVVVIGAYAAAHASILTKARGSDLHPAGLVFGQMVCGIVPLGAIAFASEGSPFSIDYTFRGVGSILYLALVGTIAAFWLYYWLLQRVESTKAMTIALVTPLVAVLAGAMVLDEKLSTKTFLGAGLILGSVSLIVFRKRLSDA